MRYQRQTDFARTVSKERLIPYAMWVSTLASHKECFLFLDHQEVTEEAIHPRGLGR
jgi:hypothetical protein